MHTNRHKFRESKLSIRTGPSGSVRARTRERERERERKREKERGKSQATIIRRVVVMINWFNRVTTTLAPSARLDYLVNGSRKKIHTNQQKFLTTTKVQTPAYKRVVAPVTECNQ